MFRFPLDLLKAAHRLKRLTLQLPKLRCFQVTTENAYNLILLPKRVHLLPDVLSELLSVVQAFMYGEEEPDIGYWKQLAEKRRYFQPISFYL